MVVNLILRTIVIYLSVLVVMRLMGKREVGQLSTFDLVVAIMIAEIAVFPLEDLSIPIYIGLIPVATLLGAEIFFSYLCLYSRFFRELIEGRPSLIIADGKIMEKEMRRQRYNINDLLGQLREKNVFDISDVQYAILETSGELSVIVNPSKRPLVPGDLNINPPAEKLPTTLILDGEVLLQNLAYLNISPEWLESKLREHNLQSRDVLFASIDCRGELFISEKQK